MCGICGGVGVGRFSVLDKMAACLTHRGPDSTGTHIDDTVMMANTRLSVIDLESGDQPIYNEDESVVVVYNGEIYNFERLRSRLSNQGHTFTTDTDTEVIVHGYEAWGADVFERLNGMFAIALWDTTEGRMFLARDRAGIKPLYYAFVDGNLLFASEPKSILRSGLVDPAVDTDALAYFLQLRYSPSHTSLFRGIETVLPGTYLELNSTAPRQSCTTHQYWSLADTPDRPPTDPVTAVREHLSRAVERQLVSDVPVGFYLSGGLDTSSVVAMADEHTEETIHTFCMGFDSQRWDERADARAVAEHFGTNHHELIVDDDYINDFPKLIWHADEPKRNLYPYYVAEKMSDHVTVALGGLGADELFGGYVYRFNRLEELNRLRQEVPQSTRSSLSAAAGRLTDHQVTAGDLSDDERLAELQSLEHLDDSAQLYVLLNSTDVIGDARFYQSRVFGDAFEQPIDPAQWVRDRYSVSADDCDLRDLGLRLDFGSKMPDDFLLVEDRMSMAHSLESRVPFLDNELIDLALSLPLSMKFDSSSEGPTVGKAILREAMRPKLPDAVFEKDKQGFTMPTFPFAKQELLPVAKDILADPYVVRHDYIRDRYIEDLLTRPPEKSLTPHYKLLWKIVALEIWYQMYIIDDVAGPQSIDYYFTA